MELRSPSAALAFWTAFALYTVPPVLLLALAGTVGGENIYVLLYVGAVLALLVDAGLVVLGIARAIRGGSGRWGTLLGVFAGAVVCLGGLCAILNAVQQTMHDF